MTRKEEIDNAMVAYSNETEFDGGDYICEVAKEKAFIAGARWANNNPRKVYVVVRCEEHDDYIEKVFVDKTKANEYCNKFEGNPNEYGRYYEEMEVTL